MKGRPIDQLVYEYMFTKPKASDPQNFHALLHRHLILEVRQEVHSFYGHLDTQEAKYPGLDYCNPIHRIRLSRWAWHRRLFRAFDGLRLTHSEISNLTKWEGTKWAKERFERDSGITIRDTADEGMSAWVPPEERPAVAAATPSEDEEDSDGDLESIGIALNQRLLERTARQEAGANITEPLDEEWEQWLKNAIDSGELPFSLGPGDAGLDDAGFAHVGSPPEFRLDLLRRTLASEGAAGMPPLQPASRQRVAPSTHRNSVPSQTVQWRSTVSNLRLPVGEGSGSNPGSETVRPSRTAQPSA
ncbi:hypothetical protein PG987_015381 [Apiospora arundinis]